MDSKFQMPTETVELPSKGLLYPEDSPLAAGTIEMKYMTAKEEDILTNTNYIRQGTAIDKLLASLIVDKSINFNDILIGDKNAIMLAARVLAYGKNYEVEIAGNKQVVDLSKLEEKQVNWELFESRINEFTFSLPKTGNIITFKILSHKDEKTIDMEVAGLQKIDKNSSPESSTRLKYMITSINGIRELKDIREFVDKYLLAQDARAFRKYYNEISPDIKLKVTLTTDDGREEEYDLPIGLSFFWPDYGL
tara:strand:- start:458 stop:1207 length:750 start_codon:yes stop_codon:yes gene_type:complete